MSAEDPTAPGPDAAAQQAPGGGPGPGTGQPPGAGPGPDPAGAGQGAAPSEEQLRAAYEAELERIDAIDMIAQAAVSLLNIGARRLGAPAGAPDAQGAPSGAGRDLQQAGDAIDAARALLAILERRIPAEVGPLRDALSRLQMAYAGEVQASGAGGSAPGAPGEASGAPAGAGSVGAAGTADGQGGPAGGRGESGGESSGEGPGPDSGPGPAESSGRLWVPGR